MRITLEQARLLKSLHMIEHAVNDRSALPILANVLLETTQQELLLTATDLDVGVRYRLPLTDAPEEGAVTLPARRLSTIVREFPEELVTIEVKNNHAAIITCGPSRFRLPGLPAEDFPVFPQYDPAGTSSISQQALKTLIQRTMFAMSLEETRFILNGALLSITPEAVTLVATDGRRLAVASAPPTRASGNGASVVIPAKTIRELGRLLVEDEADEPVTIAALKDNQLLFQFGAVTVITRLLEGQFPHYESVIPAPATTTLTCDRALAAGAIRRASLMTTAASQAVVFELAKERLVISKESTELGSAREDLPATYTGSPMSAAFNPEFWLDVLKVLDAEALTIEISAPDKPAVIRLPHFTYLVLPMKLNA